MAKPKKKPAALRRAAAGAAHLGKDEEYALIARAQAGDERAMTTLLRKHHGFVCMTAKRFRGRGLEFEDLEQAGAIGLAIAVQRFDPTYDVRLTTYANWWILAEINKSVVEGGRLIHIPQRVMEEMAAIERFVRLEYARSGEQPADRVLRKKTCISKEHVANARDAMPLRFPVSLDAPVNPEEVPHAARVDLLKADATDAEETLLERERRERISAIVAAVLTPVEIAIVRCRFVDELTLEDTAVRISPLMRRGRTVTRERVRQIEERLLNKLRVHLTDQGIA
jgi:RNA polymerase primary sigma factor